ncbi:hypothetical protein LCGC14_1519040 [marine sediment metagenome]|uniref:BPL/LPL catalytic domain-containing protein n=1 Tax=marine sediment metagenome TaxID=412755 RepID=A0A0F9M0A5_9ZZZZ
MRGNFLRWRFTMLNALLTLMADGRFHSGERLGIELGVSRAAVWKVLKRLEADGFPIQRVRGKGYRIPVGAVMLDVSRIKSLLPAACINKWEWHLSQEIDSTNAEAHRLIAFDRPRPIACVSEQQSAGRGRRGREWSSPFAQNIYLSLVEPFDAGAQRLQGLSLVVGMVLAESLEECGYQGCELKWPNDLLLNGKKLAGILVELAGDLASECVVIIGVGINVLMNESASGIDQAWTSLLLSGQHGELDRNRLIATFIARLVVAIERFKEKGFATFVEAWAQRDAWIGKEVRVVAGETVIEGKNLGVSATGALRLLTATGESHINAGEVSLRLTNAS